jgi:hypothetical protein
MTPITDTTKPEFAKKVPDATGKWRNILINRDLQKLTCGEIFGPLSQVFGSLDA